ncbi:HAD family acid phosphatase [Streptomyces sp. enrichment culture]|uniref:HAD family acid phosphatase n=1 Tax=Streptomyces sp. enrichment culture TaxID=1795815 RepID=UPI003F563CC0
MRSRRPWLRRVSVTAVSATALVALAAPAEATPSAAAPTTAVAALPATAPALAADVDYDTWQRDCRAVMDQALPYVQQRIADARPGEKQAIVLDIDNTALETDFGFSFPQPANEPVLEVARYAEERGVDLFFVTARPGIIYAPTEWNLDHAGYESSGLYVRSFIDLFRNVAEYKTAQRVAIERKGYTIIANIGNSATDLSGGHAERTFKLPDYDGRLS